MASDQRRNTAAGALARRGFSDADHAETLIAPLARSYPDRHDLILDRLAGADDPDQALLGLSQLQAGEPGRVAALVADDGWLARAVAVLGGSQALAQYLVAHPACLGVLCAEPARAPGSQMRGRLRDATGEGPEGGDRLRAAYRAELIRIVARDLTSPDPIAIVDDIAAELADLADAVLGCALDLARAEIPGADGVRLAVIGLGKCGARELNYASDVDVLYVAEPADGGDPAKAVATAGRVAAGLARLCSAHTRAGSIWPLDAALRPEGNAGPLVRTLDGMAAYYRRWASDWEFQAMLKARPVAGDEVLGRAFCDLVASHVWAVGSHEGFVASSRAMRQRVIAQIPAAERDRDVKLGVGGLRDIEFSAQILQLVHGRGDDRLRVPSTLDALAALVGHGYIGRPEGEVLEAAYRFERVLEHRAQLWTLRRTHLVPADPVGRRRIARSLQEPSGEALWARWRSTSGQVRALQQRVFYSPVLEAVARVQPDALALSSEAAADRLRALGFADPGAALRHIGALTQGVSRTVEIQRQLMPAMLGWLAEGPAPDAGLLAFRQISETMGSTAWYLRALRDEGATAERLALILASSRYLVDLLRRDPSTVRLLIDTSALVPRSRVDLADSMAKVVARHDDPAAAIGAVRGLRRAEICRIGLGDILGVLTPDAVSRGLSDLTGATIEAALLATSRGRDGTPPLGVVAMGRWGGAEMGYGSDADAMVVVPDGTDADGLRAAVATVTLARRLLASPGPEPALDWDLDLRPEGRDGPLVRTVTSYVAYYGQWSLTWESQALLRAAFGAGDTGVVNAFLGAVADVRWPPDGLSDDEVTAIRRLKLRVDRERGGRAAERSRNLKLGPGGLADIEWTVQLLQLRHAGRVPGLRTTGTLPALASATTAGLVDADSAGVLERAWRLAGRLRGAAMLVRGKASDTLPADPREAAAVAGLLGMEGGGAALVEEWERTARRASRVVDRLFWGHEEA